MIKPLLNKGFFILVVQQDKSIEYYLILNIPKSQSPATVFVVLLSTCRNKYHHQNYLGVGQHARMVGQHSQESTVDLCVGKKMQMCYQMRWLLWLIIFFKVFGLLKYFYIHFVTFYWRITKLVKQEN